MDVNQIARDKIIYIVLASGVARAGNSSGLIGSGRANGIVRPDRAGPNLNWAAILLAQPDSISGQRASGSAHPM